MNMEMMVRGKVPTPADIKDLVEGLASLPKVDLPLKHHHSQGTYVREILMPAGSIVVGKVHKTRHLNILISGECTIWTVQEKMKLKGPVTFESMAGVQKVLYMHTDCLYMTVHPTDEVDLNILEGLFIQPQEQLPLFPQLDQLMLGEGT